MARWYDVEGQLRELRRLMAPGHDETGTAARRAADPWSRVVIRPRRGGGRGRVLRWVRTAAQQGALRSGDELPSERDLARKLEVGRTAVRNALAELTRLGLIEPADATRRRRMR